MMTLRRRILLTTVALAAVTACTCVGLVYLLQVADGAQRSLRTSYTQLRAIDAVAASSTHLSEQIAELFILGEQNVPSYEEAVERLEAALASLGEATRAGEAATEYGLTVASHTSMYAMQLRAADIRNVGDEVMALLKAGRRAAAERLFRDELEGGLDLQMQALIETSLALKDRDVRATVAAIDARHDLAVLLAGALAGLVALVVAVTALMLNRHISAPVAQLIGATEALERGELGWEVPPLGKYELGRLAMRFNAMSRKLAEHHAALLRTNATLEQTVAARTSELRDRTADLETANAQLRDLDASRARFLADVSHELRTPLTVLRTHAEVALRDREQNPDDLREALAAVVPKVGQMARLVDELMFIARSEAGTVAFDFKPVLMQEVLSECLVDGQLLARSHDVIVAADLAEAPLVVHGDAQRLRQVVMIMLDNAIKFSPKGGRVVVTLEARAEDAALSVTDEGPGLTPAERKQVFKRFHRGASVLAMNDKAGSGLGLSIARSIVEAHGGSIAIGSAPDRGARVTIALPSREAVEPA